MDAHDRNNYPFDLRFHQNVGMGCISIRAKFLSLKFSRLEVGETIAIEFPGNFEHSRGTALRLIFAEKQRASHFLD
jgi:hypothetical protein